MKRISILFFCFFVMFPTLVFSDPATPTGLILTPGNFSITVSWTINTTPASDEVNATTGYYIYYWVVGDTDPVWRIDVSGVNTSSHLITGLEKGESYEVKLTAYSGSGDSESGFITHTETTTNDDVDTEIVISGADEIKISLSSNAVGADYYTVEVVEGTAPNQTTISDPNDKISPSDSVTVNELTPEGSYHITITLTYGSTESSSTEIEIYNAAYEFESTNTFLSLNSDSIEEGCFISSTSNKNNLTVLLSYGLVLATALLSGFVFRKMKFLLFIALYILIMPLNSNAETEFNYKNTFGIKGGWFEAAEDRQKDVYDQIIPFSLFYERKLFSFISTDIELGYSKSDGKEIGDSGPTEVVSELEMYPASISLNINYDFRNTITGYIGAGGDWWMIEEKSASGKIEKEVSGWHAKAGVKMFSEELETYKKLGCLFEVSHSQIDKFGENDIELGGWKFNFGLMYCM